MEIMPETSALSAREFCSNSQMISIGCFESVAPLYMPKLVAGFKKCYPDITLQYCRVMSG